MRYFSLFTAALRWLLLASFLSAGVAMAQQEPTMAQIYATAEAGKLDQAQVMVQQVLVAHPKSAKAHYVQAELYARQGNLSRARDALSQAQALAPGLPFAKPDAVAALEHQLSAPRALAAPAGSTGYSPAPQSHASSGSWLLPALLAAGVIGVAFFLFRRRTTPSYEPAPVYNSGLAGAQTFGQPGMQGAYGQQPVYSQPGYGQAPGTGLGGRIMGGVATGLAVGAGVVAAEAIGRSLMGNHDGGAQGHDYGGSNNYQPLDNGINGDMGGQNFGISDTSWDDGSSAGGGGSDGGGGWDN